MSQYRPLGLVGQGQYGQVYLAYSPLQRGLVALKALHPQRFPTRNFLRELRFLLGFNHPQVVRCHTLDYWQGRRCLVMDYGEGGTLRGLLEQERHLPLLLALELTAEVLAGLQYIHGQGIIHCDIKPENILLRLTRQAWRAQISDLGVARIEAEVESAGHTGSPAYMAPERFYGKYSPTSDLYAVGILLFEMMTGERPFRGTPVELMSAHLSQSPEISPGLPFLVQTLLRKALSKLPQKRYQTAAEMSRAVKLAHDVLLAEGKQFYPLFPKSATWFQAWQSRTTYPLDHPLTELIAVEEAAYGICDHQIFQFSVDGSPRSSMAIQAPAKKLYASQVNYYYRDAVGHLYLGEQSASALIPLGHPEHHENYVLGIEAQGKWLVQAPADLSQPLEIMHWPRGTVYTCALLNPELSRLQHLISVNARYGLAVVGVSKGQQTQLHLFNRRGQALLMTGLPFRIRQVTQSRRDPWQFLALTPDQPQALILLRLKPWQVQRLTLSFSPRWITATPWGYAVADQERVVGLSETGELLGGIAVKDELTGIALGGDRGLWLASWDGEKGKLEWVEFSAMGLDLIF
ncbi:serine/threonine-protein kinase [Synechococcus sp. PCC 6312]|uniref:serine/threonine-protein kinase n=1 Tax=Synechococcus sp. (strain ATCC 27167 / PCC 6312) TaxID=195253 RepID=UPI00029F4B82|nr:serine/threonine-protein kinase [Synechococcus sp. PCC 6312]AFY60425.1 protein kinase family protein [Synechococcus sp. PCC 6312]